MKSFLLLVVLIAVLKANCRSYTNEPDGPALKQVLSGFEKPQTYDVDHQMKKNVNEQNHIKLRGKAEKGILKKLINNLKSIEDKLTQANSEIKMELQDIEMHQDNITNMNKELKIEFQSMKETQQNITGKLDLLEIVNSNQDTKLDNIITKNTEVKMELQSLKENQVNNTGKLDLLVNVNSNQDTKLNNILTKNTEVKTELQYLKENQENNTGKLDLLINVNSNQDTKLHNILTKNTEVKTELQYLKENQENNTGKLDLLVDVNSNQDTKLNNILTKNSELKTELQSLKENQVNITGKLDLIDTKLDSVISNNPGCPEGLFYFSPSKQCFRFLNDTVRSWYESNTSCHALGLELAMPILPISLRSYLITTYRTGIHAHTWIGARGDGSYMRWQRTGELISNSDPLWNGYHQSSRVTTSDCLWLDTYQNALNAYPNQPYRSMSCFHRTGANAWALCEMVRT